MSPTVLVELSPSLDAGDWAVRYARGEVPDRAPYGLHRLADAGLSVLFRKPPHALPIVQLSRGAAKLTGGARWPESILGNPPPSVADVRFFWEERSAVPALLMRGRRQEQRPVVSGIIWNTESKANIPAVGHWATRTAMRRADAVFVNSAGQIPVLCTEWGIPSSRVHFVHFGIDKDFWDPASPVCTELSCGHEQLTGDSSARHARQLVVSVGNDRHRDHTLLLAAMRQVRAKLAQVRLELVTSTTQEIAAEIGYWHRSATHLQLRDLYRKAQVVAICTRPNLHVSGATAILESMAMGKAVVATRTPGLEDYVVHGETGLLVSPEDPDAVAHALIELLTDPDRSARMGAAARERVLRVLSTDLMNKKLAGVVRSVI